MNTQDKIKEFDQKVYEQLHLVEEKALTRLSARQYLVDFFSKSLTEAIEGERERIRKLLYEREYQFKEGFQFWEEFNQINKPNE